MNTSFDLIMILLRCLLVTNVNLNFGANMKLNVSVVTALLGKVSRFR